MPSFGNLLWKARIAKGWSQAELAERIGVTGPAVGSWENDKSHPREENYRALRKALGGFDSIVASDFGLWLRTAREARHWTVADLARESGISKVAIYNIEAGKTQYPTQETQEYLREALGADDAVADQDIATALDESKKVFISYRRENSKWQARYLQKCLVEVLPKANVFMDVDSIKLGTDYVDKLEEMVYECSILLALIGPGWLEVKDASGRRRLDNPDDPVRVELRQALSREIPVVPIIFDNASMPLSADLPEDIREFARRHAETINHLTADSDANRLLNKLGLED